MLIKLIITIKLKSISKRIADNVSLTTTLTFCHYSKFCEKKLNEFQN